MEHLGIFQWNIVIWKYLGFIWIYRISHFGITRSILTIITLLILFYQQSFLDDLVLHAMSELVLARQPNSV